MTFELIRLFSSPIFYILLNSRYLGEVNIDELSGGGAVDHLAFRASGSKDLIDRLKSLSIPYRERMVEVMNLFQLFVEDRNNITLELNYWDD